VNTNLTPSAMMVTQAATIFGFFLSNPRISCSYNTRREESQRISTRPGVDVGGKEDEAHHNGIRCLDLHEEQQSLLRLLSSSPTGGSHSFID